MSEQLAFEQARWNRGAVQLHERALGPGAQIVNGAGDELFARSGFPVNQHCGIGRRDSLHLLQNLPKRGAAADNLIEIHLGADFLLEIEVLLRELVFEIRYLPVRNRVLDRDRHLVCDLHGEIDLVRGELLFLQPGESDDTEDAVPADKWQDAASLEALGHGGVFIETELGYRGGVARPELAAAENPAAYRAVHRDLGFFPNESLALRKIDHIAPQIGIGRVRQRHADQIAAHHAPDAGRDGSQDLAELEIRNHGVGDFEEQLQPVLRKLVGFEIERVVDRQRRHIRNHAQKAHFLPGISVRMLACEDQAPNPPMHGGQRKHACGLDALLLHLIDHAGEPCLPVDVGNHQRFLMLIHPARHGRFRWTVYRRERLATSFGYVPVNSLRCCVVLSDADAIELNNLAKFRF